MTGQLGDQHRLHRSERLAPGGLRARHQQDVVLVVELVGLVEEGERGTRLGLPALDALRGQRRGLQRGDGRRGAGQRTGYAVQRLVLHHGLGDRSRRSLGPTRYRGPGYGDALRSAERAGPAEQVLRQSLAGNVAAIGHVKAPSRPLARPWRRDPRPRRPTPLGADRAPARPSTYWRPPRTRAAAIPTGAPRHPGRCHPPGWHTIRNNDHPGQPARPHRTLRHSSGPTRVTSNARGLCRCGLRHVKR